MTDEEHGSPAWLERAVSDPASVFTDPEAVASSPDLSLEEKVRVLRSWEYDAAELEVAEEEGMQGPRDGLLQRIMLVLARLTGGCDAEHVGPTKQHGLVDPSK